MMDLNELTLPWLRTPEGREWLRDQLRESERPSGWLLCQLSKNYIRLLRLLLEEPELQWRCGGQIGTIADDDLVSTFDCRQDAERLVRARMQHPAAYRNVCLERRIKGTAPGPWERERERVEGEEEKNVRSERDREWEQAISRGEWLP